jgi:hypothetical protein
MNKEKKLISEICQHIGCSGLSKECPNKNCSIVQKYIKHFVIREKK